MGAKQFLGELEHVALMAVWRLGRDAYGAAIQQEIERWTGRRIAVSAIYVTLMRLERRGFVRSWLADPTPVRGGKARRHFALLPDGERGLRETRSVLDRIWADVDGSSGAEVPR